MIEKGKNFLFCIDKETLAAILPQLLKDRTTEKNIIFATEEYIETVPDLLKESEISPEFVITHLNSLLIPRTLKEEKTQVERTKQRAEVHTPSWLCNQMNNILDEEWFGRKNIFNNEDVNAWFPNRDKVLFEDGMEWQKYITNTYLEMACGEAPYVVSRYDSTTGIPIKIEDRIGILDRKLRIVGENTNLEEEWIDWTKEAFKSVYGYEFQGDSLFLARLNLVSTFSEYLQHYWKRTPTVEELREIADIVSWNFWQMDGITGTIPFKQTSPNDRQLELFASDLKTEENEFRECLCFCWRKDRKVAFNKIQGSNMKFDFVIGNPPYQETSEGTSDKPIYNYFMDGAYKIADKVELITPARFLFNAGKTPSDWNKKMLSDPHLGVLIYELDSSKLFSGTDIKGGVVVTYRDATKNIGPIGDFIPHNELNSIKKKVLGKNFSPFSNLVYSPESYRLSKVFHQDNPTAINFLSKGHLFDLTTNIFEKIPQFFFDTKPEDTEDYIQIMGREHGARTSKWIKRKYLDPHDNLDYFKIILPKSNGSGTLGEELSTPVIGHPVIGHTQTFISIGAFKTLKEANACLKYVKTKFARTLLGILKVTQDNKKRTWSYVPIQDWTKNSDIDWSKDISDIDKQLYKKYGLTKSEINFIESKVKEMN